MKLKDWWNYKAYPGDDEGPKFFSKEWFKTIFIICGVIAIGTILVFIVGDTKVVDVGAYIIIYIIAAFALGCVRGYKNCEKDYEKREKRRKEEEEYRLRKRESNKQ